MCDANHQAVVENILVNIDNWRRNYQISVDAHHWAVFFIGSPGGVAVVSHSKFKLSAFQHLVAIQIAAIQFLTVKFYRFDISVLSREILSNHLEFLTILKVYRHLFEMRHTNDEHAACRCHRIESHCAHHVPSRHLTAVLVTAETIRLVGVKLIHDLVDDLLCFNRFSNEIEQISHVM